MENENKSNGVFKSFLELFTSLKTAIFLMILLAVISIAGTIVPQAREEMFYIKEYGFNLFRIFKSFGLTDLYHSWFFILLLSLLNINVFLCFIKRFNWKLENLKKDKTRYPTEKLIKGMKNSSKLMFLGTVSRAKEIILDSLESKRFKIKEKMSGESVSIAASKGLIGQFGSDIIHLSILIIIIGAFIGTVFGFKDFIVLNEGEKKHIAQGGFDLRLDKFNIEFYKDTSKPKDYFSTLAVLENNKEIFTKTIEVNDPLRYRGIWFYQSSYGQAWRVIRKATFKIKANKKSVKEKIVTLDFNKDFLLQEIGLKLKMVGFVADFIFDTNTKQVFSKTTEHRNPAVLLEVYENGELTSKPWIFLNFPEAHSIQRKDSRFTFQLVNYNPIPFSGLQVTKDPGVNIVWLGSFLLTLGMILAFTVSHKKLWFFLKESQGKIVILIGGSVNKNQIGFEKEFLKITEDMDISLKGN